MHDNSMTTSFKSLSINCDSLPPADEGCGEGEQSAVARLGLFEADQEFAIVVGPGVAAFDYPSAWFVSRIASFLFRFVLAGADVRSVAALQQRSQRLLAQVSCIGA